LSKLLLRPRPLFVLVFSPCVWSNYQKNCVYKSVLALKWLCCMGKDILSPCALIFRPLFWCNKLLSLILFLSYLQVLVQPFCFFYYQREKPPTPFVRKCVRSWTPIRFLFPDILKSSDAIYIRPIVFLFFFQKGFIFVKVTKLWLHAFFINLRTAGVLNNFFNLGNRILAYYILTK